MSKKTHHKDTGASNSTRSLITVLALFLSYPIGLLLVWFWTQWPRKLKVTLTILPFVLIVILFSLTLIAVNPSKQFSQANDTKRSSDINSLVEALIKYRNEFGSLPKKISVESKEISKSGADICNEIVPTKIAALPVDPLVAKNTGVWAIENCDNSYSTGYNVSVESDGRIKVSASKTESGNEIMLIR